MGKHRFVDKPPYYFSYAHVLKTKGIWLECSNCHHLAILKEKENELTLTCLTCFKLDKIEEQYDKIYNYCYTGLCNECGKYIRYDVESSTYPIITRPCKNCGKITPLNLQKNEAVSYKYKKYHLLGIDQMTGNAFFFLDTFKGKNFWALNLEHLNYLIDYVASDLRERDESIMVWKTASHTIPKFMKASKNRTAILRKLNKMKEMIL